MADAPWRLRRLAQILAESGGAPAAIRDVDIDPAGVHLANVPLERIRRVTSELQNGASGDIDDIDAVTMRLLLNDYTTAVAHLRAVAHLVEQRVTQALVLIQEARLLVQKHMKRAEATQRGAPDVRTDRTRSTTPETG